MTVAAVRRRHDRGGDRRDQFPEPRLTIAAERERGTLKRLRGTPMPRRRTSSARSSGLRLLIAEVLGLFAVGLLFYHLRLPTSAGKWWTLAWVFILGTSRARSSASRISGLSSLGDELVPGDHAPVPGAPVHLRGCYVPFSDVPPWLRQHRGGIPAEMDEPGLALGLPAGRCRSLEPPTPGSTGRPALVLAAWIAGRIGAVPDNVPLADHQGRLTVPDSGPGPSVAARPPRRAGDAPSRRVGHRHAAVGHPVRGRISPPRQRGRSDRRISWPAALAVGATVAMAPWYLPGRPPGT